MILEIVIPAMKLFLAVAPFSTLGLTTDLDPKHRHDNFDQDLPIIPGRPRRFESHKSDFGAYN